MEVVMNCTEEVIILKMK